MDSDLILAIAHHLAVFALVGVFTAEFVLVRPGLSAAQIRQLGRIDAAYGGLAAVVIIVGVFRVIFGAAGWEYYVGNLAFWAKMVAFLVVGLLTIPPTLAIRKWQKGLAIDGNYTPLEAEVSASRRYIHLQAAILLLIPIFAAAMARGYGS